MINRIGTASTGPPKRRAEQFRDQQDVREAHQRRDRQVDPAAAGEDRGRARHPRDRERSQRAKRRPRSGPEATKSGWTMMLHDQERHRQQRPRTPRVAWRPGSTTPTGRTAGRRGGRSRPPSVLPPEVACDQTRPRQRLAGELGNSSPSRKTSTRSISSTSSISSVESITTATPAAAASVKTW